MLHLELSDAMRKVSPTFKKNAGLKVMTMLREIFWS